jgi:SNW domain-containing protein 1
MVEAQVDPLEPPKHKHTKAPRGPPSPPVPVLHSPPRKLTVADQQAWKIPPCVSNWKNARGFIIPLDKRIAADGRNLQEVTINNKFATMAEALFIAERKATEDLKMRNEQRKKMALKEKEEREEALREMANRARMERAGIRTDDHGGAGIYGPGGASAGGGSRYDDEAGSDDGHHEAARRDQRRERFDGRGGAGSSDSEGEGGDVQGFQEESEADKIARQQRERIRMERRKEREREIRLENMKVRACILVVDNAGCCTYIIYELTGNRPMSTICRATCARTRSTATRAATSPRRSRWAC